MTMTELIQRGIAASGGKQEALAVALDMSPSGLSKRINGESGWQEQDINRLLEIAGCEIVSIENSRKKIATLKHTIKILMEDIG